MPSRNASRRPRAATPPPRRTSANPNLYDVAIAYPGDLDGGYEDPLSEDERHRTLRAEARRSRGALCAGPAQSRDLTLACVRPQLYGFTGGKIRDYTSVRAQPPGDRPRMLSQPDAQYLYANDLHDVSAAFARGNWIKRNARAPARPGALDATKRRELVATVAKNVARRVIDATGPDVNGEVLDTYLNVYVDTAKWDIPRAAFKKAVRAALVQLGATVSGTGGAVALAGPEALGLSPAARAALVRKLVDRAKRRILADRRAGTLPAVRTFSALHDYVDANMYLLTDDGEENPEVLALLQPPGTDTVSEATNNGAVTDVYNDALNQVHAWLADGALAHVKPARRGVTQARKPNYRPKASKLFIFIDDPARGRIVYPVNDPEQIHMAAEVLRALGVMETRVYDGNPHGKHVDAERALVVHPKVPRKRNRAELPAHQGAPETFRSDRSGLDYRVTPVAGGWRTEVFSASAWRGVRPTGVVFGDHLARSPIESVRPSRKLALDSAHRMDLSLEREIAHRYNGAAARAAKPNGTRPGSKITTHPSWEERRAYEWSARPENSLRVFRESGYVTMGTADSIEEALAAAKSIYGKGTVSVSKAGTYRELAHAFSDGDGWYQDKDRKPNAARPASIRLKVWVPGVGFQARTLSENHRAAYFRSPPSSSFLAVNSPAFYDAEDGATTLADALNDLSGYESGAVYVYDADAWRATDREPHP